MKKIYSMIVAVCFAVLMAMPSSAMAFAEEPVAFVVFDNTGNVHAQTLRQWREPVKWAYHFPDFKIIDTDNPKKVAAEHVFGTNDKGGVSQDTMRAIATEIPAEAVVLVIVHDMSEQIISGFYGRYESDSTYVRTSLVADIYVYRKTSDKFSKKKIRERDVVELGQNEQLEEKMKWAICKEVNLMEGRPIIS